MDASVGHHLVGIIALVRRSIKCDVISLLRNAASSPISSTSISGANRILDRVFCGIRSFFCFHRYCYRLITVNTAKDFDNRSISALL
jgi:hypothetical protein